MHECIQLTQLHCIVSVSDSIVIIVKRNDTSRCVRSVRRARKYTSVGIRSVGSCERTLPIYPCEDMTFVLFLRGNTTCFFPVGFVVRGNHTHVCSVRRRGIGYRGSNTPHVASIEVILPRHKPQLASVGIVVRRTPADLSSEVVTLRSAHGGILTCLRQPV